MSNQIVFTKEDIGCWADGAFGHQYCRDRLAAVVCLAWQRGVPVLNFTALMASLYNNMPDDAWDEDVALDILNGCSDGVGWEFVDGDLMCVDEDKED